MEYVIEIFCFTIIFAYLFYKWANKNFECFSKRNVPHENPVFFVGNNLTVLEGKESSAELLIRLHNQFKNEKIYGYYGFRCPYFFIRDPELIQKIGIKDVDSFKNHSENKVLMSDESIGNMLNVLQDEKWTEMRQMLAPVFTENKISQVSHIISQCNKEAIKYLNQKVKPQGTEIDFTNYFERYVNDVIASAAFGLEINSYKDGENEFSKMASTLLRTRSLCAAVKSFYLTIASQVLKIYRLNRIYIKILAYVRGFFRKTIPRDTANAEESNRQTKSAELLMIIKSLIRKSSSAIISIFLTIFPQVSIIFHVYSFITSIRNYVRGLFNPRLRRAAEKELISHHEDSDIDPKEKKNQFLVFGGSVVRKITASIKLLILTIFPQIILISRIYFLTKTVFKYLRGKTTRQEGKNKKKKLSKMESALLKFERLVVIIKLLIITYFPKFSKIVKLNAFNKRALNHLKSAASLAIQQQQENKIVRHDMIQLMLEAQKQKENSLENEADDTNTLINNPTKDANDELVAQCILFLFAGLGPMTKMLCNIVHELSKNHEIEEKLFEEVERINTELNGSEITYETIQKMKYLDMIICETLRKWPSLPILDRVCSKPYTVTDDSGESIAEFKPGDIICFSVYGSHFDEKYFENPFTFDPERFSEQNKSSIKPSTYFPFGVGPRSCIGHKFGLMVVKIMLYHLVQEFKFAPGTKSIDDLFAANRRIQLKQAEFYWMTILPRIIEPDKKSFETLNCET